MPSGALDVELNRHIIDVLVREYETGGPPQAADVADGVPMPVVGCAWGLYAQVNRHAKAAMVLSDNGMSHEAHVHLRVALEHAIYLHWVIERGSEGVDAMLASQAANVRRSVDTAREAAVVLPPAVEREIDASDVRVDERKAVRQFRKLCQELDVLGLYFMYGVESGFVHPSVLTINAYARNSATLTTEPDPGLDRGTPLLLAQCLIWARQDLDRILPGRRDAQGLDMLAQSVGAQPLPPYRPVEVRTPIRRKRSSRRQSAT